MGATPRDIAVDINDLLKAGQTSIPAVAEEYDSARTALTAGTVAFALMRDSSLGLDSSDVHSAWSDCLDGVREMLRTEAATMRKIGEALVDIAIKEFGDTDEAARKEYVTLYGRIEK